MNAHHFEEAKEKKSKDLACQPKDVTFFIKLKKVMKFYKNICKHKAVIFGGKKGKVQAQAGKGIRD
jgi:hypothetical protein